RGVRGEALEDAGHARRSSVGPRGQPFGRIGEEARGLLVELRVEAGGSVGLSAQIRTGERGAHDGEVHARLLEGLAENTVLDLAERVLRAAHAADLPLPDRAVEVAAVPDARRGIPADDGLDGEQVVRVDPEGEALTLTGEGGGLGSGEGAERFRVQRIGLHPEVVNEGEADPV